VKASTTAAAAAAAVAPLESITEWQSKHVDEQAAVERLQVWTLKVATVTAAAAVNGAAEHD
jgi:hypothetical protein